MWRWGGNQPVPRDQYTAAMGGLIGGAALTLAFSWAAGVFDDPAPPVQADIEAAVVVDATTIEMRGYGPDGELGTFLYDCRVDSEQPVAGVEPTLVCTQREG